MMAVIFTLAATITVTLPNPNLNARSLVRHLAASKKSLTGLCPLCFPSSPTYTVMQMFYLQSRQCDNSTTPLLQRSSRSLSTRCRKSRLFCSRIWLRLSTSPSLRVLPTPGGSHLSDARAALIAALNTLLLHESGIKHFAESDALTQHIDILIKLWISFSSSAVFNPAATDLVNIIDTLFNYLPTREALEYVVSNTKRPLFCKGLERLLVTSDNLDNPKFPLCASLTTNMCGLGVLVALVRACEGSSFIMAHSTHCAGSSVALSWKIHQT
ncbi:hypothetical protein BDZ89DRAFT_68191 [Hymenopellis radicata]|nr:hypothetical protein BDZ89DRAFT_68191 [Hymenopellis radicata]